MYFEILIFHFLFHYRDLIRLNLGRNKLESVPHAALERLHYLEILEMSDNQVKEIQAGGFTGKINYF